MSLHTMVIGCKLNQAEMLAKLSDAVYTTASLEEADEVWIHTCAVTKEAERKSLKAVRRALSFKKKVYVSGCLPALKRESDELGKEGVDLLDLDSPLPFLSIEKKAAEMPCKARVFVKIQDGCVRRCAFCVVPQTRPRLHSRDPDAILRETQAWVQAGTKEIVLTGASIGLYGLPTRKPSRALPDLLKRIANETDLKRLRLTSFDPLDFTPSLLRSFQKISILCPHLHLSLQSGDNTILKKMRRGYTVEEVVRIADNLRSLHPSFSLTTDILVGFPGETHSAFQNTLNAMERLQFARCHIFPYSPRPNTLAASLPDILSKNERKQRVQIASTLSEKLEKDYANHFIGKEQKVLIEQQQGETSLGYTPYYCYTAIPAPIAIGTIVEVVPQTYAPQLYQFKSGGLYASLCAHQSRPRQG